MAGYTHRGGTLHCVKSSWVNYYPSLLAASDMRADEARGWANNFCSNSTCAAIPLLNRDRVLMSSIILLMVVLLEGTLIVRMWSLACVAYACTLGYIIGIFLGLWFLSCLALKLLSHIGEWEAHMSSTLGYLRLEPIHCILKSLHLGDLWIACSVENILLLTVFTLLSLLVLIMLKLGSLSELSSGLLLRMRLGACLQLIRMVFLFSFVALHFMMVRLACILYRVQEVSTRSSATMRTPVCR